MIVVGEYVARWVMDKAGHYVNDMKAIGWEKDGNLIAGATFENYTGRNMIVHQRMDGSPPRAFWFAFADYSYNQLGCLRVTGLVESTNEKALKLNKHIGFEVEATLKDAGKEGDLIVMVLWRDNCRFLNWGKK